MIGEKYKVIRKARGLTLRDVETATGISNSYLSQLENGKISDPSFRTAKILHEYYGIKQVVEMDELSMLLSTMTDAELQHITSYAKFILSNRK